MPEYLNAEHGYGGIWVGARVAAALPEAANGIASVIATASYLAATIGASLAKCLSTNIQMGVTIYNAVHSSNTQQDMVKEAANLYFENDPQSGSLFQKLLSSAGQVNKGRNSVAHGLWTRPRTPPGVDDLLRIDPGTYLEWHEEVLEAGQSRVDITHINAFAIEVWTAIDFAHLVDDIMHVNRLLRLFWAARELSDPEAAPVREQLNTLLKVEKRKFADLTRHAQSGPLTPKSWLYTKTPATP